MANTTNYGWVTPDDTALVKDGAAAIRTLGTSADTTVYNNDLAAIKKTIVDAKGDIIAATAADTVARLAVGATNGMVLTVDSTEATGLKYALPAGAGANWSLLNSGGTALTGASTITVSGISAKDKILILVGSASSASSAATISVRFNTDTAANYTAFGINFVEGGGSYSVDLLRRYTQTALTSIPLGKMGSNAAAQVSGFLLASGCNSAGVKAYDAAGSGSTEGGNSQQAFTIAGVYNSATTISSISIFSSSGNFDEGTVYVYTSA